MENKYSLISYRFAIGQLIAIAVLFGLVFLVPSPPFCYFIGMILMVVSPILGIIGLSFGIAGFNEPTTAKQGFGFVVNLLVALLSVIAFFSGF